ncbi:hypothetical protein F66182_1900 [Fusarium sp. NRRL 66182]|nr:hypothetical protein F66182_1900 [Fusarium sp. NRRL 66182]
MLSRTKLFSYSSLHTKKSAVLHSLQHINRYSIITMSRTIETSFEAAIGSGKINGAVICATDSKGEFVYNNAIGQRILLNGEKQPQKIDDVVCLASGTKLIATIAAMTCVEDGLLTLEGDLSSIAPELAEKQILTGFSEEDDTPLLEPAVRPITLEMLLTHSAGLTYHFHHPGIKKWTDKYSPKDYERKKKVEQVFCYPLAHQPGGSWMYGPGVDWAGRIVERVTGKTLEERIHERIMKPLGLKPDAQFFPVTREDLRERFVNLNPDDPNGLGRAVMGEFSDINSRTDGCFGGQGLTMPASDYVKIMQSLLANDAKILKPATVQDMFRQHLSPEAAAGHQAMLEGPIGPFFRVGIDAETKLGHGIGGLLTLEDVDGWYGANTMSWGGGLTLTWFIDRKNDLCGIGAILAALPLDVQVATDLKDVFRKDIYKKYAAWKEEQHRL